MPNAIIKSYAKKSDKSVKKIDSYWNDAKDSADEKFKGRKNKYYWAYVNAITKRRAGLDEALTFKSFLSTIDEEGTFNNLEV